jgi:hypothetical protein
VGPNGQVTAILIGQACVCLTSDGEIMHEPWIRRLLRRYGAQAILKRYWAGLVSSVPVR